MATRTAIIRRISDMMEEGHSDSFIIAELYDRNPDRDLAEVTSFVNDIRGVFSVVHSVRGKKRPITPTQLTRLETYYRQFSNLDLVASLSDGGEFIGLQGTELAVLRLFEKFHETLEDAKVSKIDGSWYFIFRK